MKHVKRLAHCMLLLSALVTPGALRAQDAAAPAAAGFTKAQIEQLVAPIALYPDSLLSQILMASTYPLEIVEAQRWMGKNPGLTGAKLEAGLKEQDWDPSVKSMCGFPDVLKDLNENLDWTQDLGDAFLGQKTEVMDSVQIMRGKADAAGNLKDSKEMNVTKQEDKIIVIESTDPEVIYVPDYSPTVVYGGWGYSSWYYPSMYYPPAPGYGMLAFGVGVAWGAAMWGGCNWGWGGGDVDIDVNRQNNFNRNTNINGDRVSNRPAGSGGKGSWSHDATHRKGVNYKNGATAKKYGGTGASNRVSTSQARGYSGSRPTASQRPAGGSVGQRPSVNSGSLGASQRGAGSVGASQRSSTGGSVGASQRTSGGSAGASQRSSSASSRSSSAYSGSGSSSMDRSSSSRGASSRGSSSYGGSRSSSGGGGGSRGGGGGGSRGGGGGGGGRR